MAGFITEKDRELVLDIFGQDVYDAMMQAKPGETFLSILVKLGKM